MSSQVSKRNVPIDFPKDARTGLTLPLTRSLDSRALGQHRAMVAVELEVMAKKMDRFGWDRDRGSAAHDRIITDWMDALHDYPLAEVQAACREWVKASPRHMPNEGDILKLIAKARFDKAAAFKASMPQAEPKPRGDRVTAERAAEILREAGMGMRP